MIATATGRQAVAPASAQNAAPFAFQLTPLQSRIWGARKFARHVNENRYRVWIAGRRSGKTTLALVELVEHAIAQPGALAWYVGPTLDMARELMWDRLLGFLPAAYIRSQNQVRMVLTLRNGSTIAVKSGEKPHRLVGRGITRLVVDEFAQQPRLSWEKVAPALADRDGDALLITTPEGIASWAYEFWQRGVERHLGMWRSWQTSSDQAGTLTREALEALRAAMDPRMYAQEMGAEFTALVSRIVHQFDSRREEDGGHVTERAEDAGGPVLVGMDFNVDPMSAVLASRVGRELHVWDSLSLPNSSTEEMARAIREKVGDRQVVVVPDASGKNRTTAAVGETDFVQLQRAGFVLDVPGANPPVKDRHNALNALFRTDDGKRHLFVHPRCTPLIQSLQGYRYLDGTTTPNDREGWDHQVAALGYLVHRRFNRLSSAGFRIGTYT